jgi:hypothetical protein
MKYISHLLFVIILSDLGVAQVVNDNIYIYLERTGSDWVRELVPQAEFVVEDSLGRRTGIEPLADTRYDEIPNAGYGDTGVDSEDPNIPGLYAIEFVMDPATKGHYTIKVIGAGTDTLKLSIYMARTLGKGAQFHFTGTTSYGQVTEYKFYYDPDPTKMLTAERVITIDIKPGDDPNTINCRNHDDVISVAILTTNTFDATTVDPLSVRFGRTGTEASEAHHQGHSEDADGDGDLDMVLHFRFGGTGIQCGDAEAILTGQTMDGMRIRGTDFIQTIGQQE